MVSTGARNTAEKKKRPPPLAGDLVILVRRIPTAEA
jgi:hypothetical protein